MKKAFVKTAAVLLAVAFYACSKDENPTTIPVTPTSVQLASTLVSQPGSTSGSSTTSTATGSFSASLDQSQSTSNTLSYTVNYSGITPTAITLDPVSTSASTTSGTSGSTTTSNYSSSILLAGVYPTVSSLPISGTSTTPGSGTSTTPGSGTSTTPGTSTSTTPGSGTSTTPGSNFTSPVTGTIPLSQSRGDSLRRGYYQVTVRTSDYPNGILTGPVTVR